MTSCELVLDDKNPDILIFGDRYFGEDNRLYPKTVKKFFYTSRPEDRSYYDFDYSITPDHNEYSGRNFRVPFFHLQFHKDWLTGRGNYSSIESRNIRRSKVSDLSYKTKLCVIPSKKDLDFRTALWYNGLMKLGEVGFLDEGADDREYKFILCFEDVSYPGYVTEKLYNALLYTDCVPIYWGSPTIKMDFPTNCFLNWHEYQSDYLSMNRVEYYNSENGLDHYRMLYNTPMVDGNWLVNPYLKAWFFDSIGEKY